MQFRTALLAATMLAAAAAPALAAPVSGPYVSLQGGGSYLQDQSLENGTHTGNSFGGIGSGSVGYGLGNGFRLEAQGDYRSNKFYKAGPLHAGGDQQQFGGFANVLYDIDLGPHAFGFVPYVGAGVGYEQVALSNGHAYGELGGRPFYGRSTGTDGNVAFQGILGASYDIEQVPGLALTAEYRFTAIPGGLDIPGQGFDPGGTFRVHERTDGTFDHAGLVGVRYAFDTAPAARPALEAPPPVSEAVAPEKRTYVVFFDWNRSDLSARAREIVDGAARQSSGGQASRIEVDGHADNSSVHGGERGAGYNQALSLRRAEVVKSELVRDGVPANEIDIHGYGQTRPLVATGPDTREAQNRRVEIVLR